MRGLGSGLGFPRGLGQGIGTRGARWTALRTYGASLVQELDPGDLSTMFQNKEGTVPAALGSPVAIRIDKSKLGGKTLAQFIAAAAPIALSAVIDASTAPSTATYVGGVLTLTASSIGATARGRFTVTTVVGKLYRLVCSRSGGDSDCTLDIGTSSGGNQVLGNITVGANTTVMFFATSSTTWLNFYRGATATSIITGLAIKEIPGNHDFQAADANRLMLGRVPKTGRRNLLTYTEDFSNAAWPGLNMSRAAGSLTENGSAAQHYVSQTIGPVSLPSPTTGSISFKQGTGTRNIALRFAGNSGSAYAIFNPSTGELVGTSTTGSNWSIVGTPANAVLGEDGYFRASVTAADTEASGNRTAIVMMVDGTTISYAGNGTSTVLVKGVQFERGAAATAYQKVVSTWDVTEAGHRDCYYVYYDGNNFCMSTSAFPWGSDEVGAFMAITKESDAAQGMLLEFSQTIAVNAGAFQLTAPDAAAAASVRLITRGSAAGATALYTNASVAAPWTGVLSGLAKIATDTALLRANGVQVISSGTDQGSGNYGTYQLFSGRRAGSTNPFKGPEFGRILINRLPTASEIAATERHLSQNTPGVSL